MKVDEVIAALTELSKQGHGAEKAFILADHAQDYEEVSAVQRDDDGEGYMTVTLWGN